LATPLERSPNWASRRCCCGSIEGDGDEGHPKVTHRGTGDSAVPIPFQVVISDGRELVKRVARVSCVSMTDGKRNWFIDDGSGILTYVAYVKVVAWASLGA
jgi:hypothetical protein